MVSENNRLSEFLDKTELHRTQTRMGNYKKYDDASWHEDDILEEQPFEDAATHIGMFFAWLINRKMCSPSVEDTCADEVDRVRKGQMLGRDFLLECLDGKFSSDEVAKEAQPFVERYYSTKYFGDYTNEFYEQMEATVYHVRNTAENEARAGAVIERRYQLRNSLRGAPGRILYSIQKRLGRT